MCGYCCIGFIDFMLKGKSFLHYTNLFFPSDYKNNDKIKLYDKVKMKNYIALLNAWVIPKDTTKERKLEKPVISYILGKALVISIIFSTHKNEDWKIFTEKSIEISKKFLV